MNKTQLTALADKLRRLTAEMKNVGSEMKYSGYPLVEKHGQEMTGAAIIASEWADEIKKGNVE